MQPRIRKNLRYIERTLGVTFGVRGQMLPSSALPRTSMLVTETCIQAAGSVENNVWSTLLLT